MSNSKKVLIVLVVLIGLGIIAENYNERNHLKMAIAECGSLDTIAKVDSKGFECKKNNMPAKQGF
jgi:hypothetical protein